jgi:hypothetical protein
MAARCVPCGTGYPPRSTHTSLMFSRRVHDDDRAALAFGFGVVGFQVSVCCHAVRPIRRYSDSRGKIGPCHHRTVRIATAPFAVSRTTVRQVRPASGTARPSAIALAAGDLRGRPTWFAVAAVEPSRHTRATGRPCAVGNATTPASRLSNPAISPFSGEAAGRSPMSGRGRRSDVSLETATAIPVGCAVPRIARKCIMSFRLGTAVLTI